MEIINRIKLVLTKPSKFFKKLEHESGISTSFKFLLILTAFSSIISYISTKLFQSTELKIFQSLLGDSPVQPEYVNPTLTGVLQGFVITIAIVFILSAILHLWIKLFKGKAKYSKTFQILTYGSTPVFLFGWIPFIGGASLIYAVVLLIISTSILHKISKLRSTILHLIPVILVLILLILMLIAIITMITISSNGSGDIINNIPVTF